MSVDVIIKQKGLFKKKLSLKDILMDKFKYGRYNENYILYPEERGDGEITIYNPQCIGRGISVIWNEEEINEIGLHMLLPTTNSEINDFYDLIEHLCMLWKTKTFIQDGEERSLNELNDLKMNMKAYSFETLQSFLTEHDNGNFFCAMWPYSFQAKDVKHWLEDQTLMAFEKDLHENQLKDLYYANPRYYRDQDNKIMGVYTVTATVDTIFPIRPIVPFSQVNFENGESLEADYYSVALVSIEKDDMIGSLKFEDFINEISRQELHEFDSEHFYFNGLSENQILEFTQKLNFESNNIFIIN